MSYSRKVQQWKKRSQSKAQVVFVIGGFFIAGIFVVVAIGFMLDRDSKTVLADEPTVYDAWMIAQSYVEDRLKSPGSANYGNQSPLDVVTKIKKGHYKIDAWVDSQNAFGGLVRTTFVCEVQYVGSNEWKLERLELHER